MSKRLYIARWPDGTAWIVQAASLEEVADILDNEGDPFSANVEPYNGAFAIEIRPSGDVGSVEIKPASGDTGMSMIDSVLEKAFPKLDAVLNIGDIDGENREKAAIAWAEALKQEGEVDVTPTKKWREAALAWQRAFYG